MIRIGVLGAGKNATGNARKLAEQADRCRIVAIADPVAEAAATLAKEFEARPVATYEELLDDVDAVVISTPNHLHKDQSIACLQAGKHVWCEKPMALSETDAEEMTAAAELADKVTMIGFSVWFNEVKQVMTAWLKEGRLGDPVALWSHRLAYWKAGGPTGWRADPAYSGGVLYELLVHEIDWLRRLGGPIESLYGRKAVHVEGRGPRDNDTIWGIFNHANGAISTLEGSVMSPMPDYYNGVTGRDGTLYTNKWGNELFHIKAGEGQPTQITTKGHGMNKHAHFLDAIEGRCASVADFAYGLEITRLAEGVLASANSGELVKLT